MPPSRWPLTCPAAWACWCCDARCDEECQACTAAGKGSGVDGVCGPAAEGWPVSSECTAEVEVHLQCDGEGHAVTAAVAACAPYGCDATGSVCTASCAGAADCSSGAWCDLDNHTCEPERPDTALCDNPGQCLSGSCVQGVCCAAPCPLATAGSACDTEDECLSGHCAGGVCCDAPCRAECYACTAAAKGSGEDGVCGPRAAGVSLSSTCIDGAEVHRACDGVGSAIPTEVIPCTPGLCDEGGSGCTSACDEHGDCAASAWCNPSDQQCAFKREDKEACDDSLQCQSGSCVQSKCCTQPCLSDADVDLAPDCGTDSGGCAAVGGERAGPAWLVVPWLLAASLRRRQRNHLSR